MLKVSFIKQTVVAAFLVAAISFAGCKKDKDPVSVSGVSLNNPTLALVEGGTATLTATVAPANAANKAVTWKSSDAGIASVSDAGVVTAVKAGTATIIVSTADGGKTATCNVTVNSAKVSVTGVTLNKPTLTLTVGATETLTATVAPDNADNKAVTWAVTEGDAATVDAEGKVTAVKAGTATITVTTTDGSKTAECIVTVNAATVSVSGVSLDKPTLTLLVGATETLTATVAPEEATDKSVTWKSSDETVATVSAGVVTAVAKGTATITVTTTDGAKTAECIVTVNTPPAITMTTEKSGAMSFYMEGAGKVTIDWGDGSDPETVTLATIANTFTHTFADATPHDIAIDGQNITLLGIDDHMQVTALDVSNNPALTYLYCRFSQLTSIDVSNNPALTTLNCFTNRLTSLDVSNNTALEYLTCAGNNLEAEALNTLFGTLHSNTATKQLSITGNPGADTCDQSIATAKGWVVFD